MSKTIFITGATDGIGLAAAIGLAGQGHTILLHGRSMQKLDAAKNMLCEVAKLARIEQYQADLSRLDEVEALAKSIAERPGRLDVIINNAGVFKTSQPVTPEGLDARFVVNTIAPYLLTRRLLPLLNADGRVINVSSAAQSPVDLPALAGQTRIADAFQAYAQSKLALTMWSRAMAESAGAGAPTIITLNPGSMLGTKMVKEGFGVSGADINIGASIIVQAATSAEFANASGRYFDNDSGRFAAPHPDATSLQRCSALTDVIERVIASARSL